MTQELQLPVSRIDFVEFRSKIPAWTVSLEDGNLLLDCSLIAANLQTVYVSCEAILGGDLPAYVVPMERDGETNPL